ncbi:MAG: hypothetical protein RL588_957 [Pseudomonadota bacterium]|jgi:hypothetical protein
MMTQRHHEAAETARRLLAQLRDESHPDTRASLFRAAVKVLTRDPLPPRSHDRDR